MRGEYKTHHALARYTSWHVGGPADRFYRPADLADLQAFLATLPEAEPLVWLGLGSNVLVRDGGIRGTVIYTQGRLAGLEQTDATTLRAEAGVTCAKLAKRCATSGFEGGAFFAGIPGTVGGALAMNAGAFGGETWRHVVAVETIDRHGRIQRRTPGDFRVGYRHVERPPGEWFAAGHFRFVEGDPEAARQAIRALLKRRAATQPIGEWNSGSVFRNPPSDHAARLIEACGLKGKRCGGAVVSMRHANFIVNEGQATAAEIETLIQMLTEAVEARFGIRLIPEVHCLGEREATT